MLCFKLYWVKMTFCFIIFQVNFPAVMRKNTKLLSEQQRGRFLRVQMWSAVHVLVLEILGLQTLGSVRLTYKSFLCLTFILNHFLHYFSLIFFLFFFSAGAYWRVYSSNWTRVPHTFGPRSKAGILLNMYMQLCALRLLMFWTRCFSLGCSCWRSLSAWSSYYVQESSPCWISTVTFWTPCSTWC